MKMQTEHVLLWQDEPKIEIHNSARFGEKYQFLEKFLPDSISPGRR